MNRTVAVALAALLAAAGLAGAQLPAPQPLENPWLAREPLNVAHQGGNHEAPGNTLFAINESVFQGPANAFEVDLHLTADDHVVALHDPTVDRTTNGSGAVSSMTLDEIKELDPAYWWAPGNGTDHDAAPEDYVYRGVATGDQAPPTGYEANDFRIPTLHEILTLVEEQAGDGPAPYMVLEVKATSQHWRPLAQEVVAEVQAHGLTESVMVGSFNDVSTTAVKGLAPSMSTSPGLAEAAGWWASAQGPAPGSPLPQHEAVQLPPSYSVGGSPSFETMNRDMVEDAHRHDLAVHVWTINTEAGMHHWLDQGVEGILTDRPTTLDDVLQERAGS